MTELVRISHGLWRPAEVIDDPFARAAALLTVCPPTSVIAGSTAARLHGLWLPGHHSDRFEVIVHPDQPVLTRRGRNRRAEVHARRRVLQPDETTVLNGLPIVTEARAWLDLAEMLAMPDLVAAGDSALRGNASLSELSHLIERAVHRRGVIRARLALPYLDRRSRSRPESHLRYALVSAGLPRPGVNVPIFDAYGGWLAEPDLSYDDVRLALEYNGADHAKPKRMRKDITRGFGISASGWRTQEFGPSEVFGHPDQVVSLVGRLREERAHLAS